MANRGINKVILIGNVGQDPEVRYMLNGTAVTNISLATSENWRDKQNNEMREKTEWHRIVIFGKLAEIAGEYLHKGSQIYIEGSLQTRKWQDQNNQDRYTTEIVVNINGTMQMLGTRNGSQEGLPQNNKVNDSWQLQSSKKSTNSVLPVINTNKDISTTSVDNLVNFDDDIPF